MRYVTAAAVILLLFLVVAFSIQNREAVDVAILFWSVTLPKVFLILGTYVLGMLTGWGIVELVKRAF